MPRIPSYVLRPVILVLVLGVLSFVLFLRQQEAARLQNMRPDVNAISRQQLVIEDGIRFLGSIDELEQRYLANAQSFKVEIEALRGQRLTETTLQSPELPETDRLPIQKDVVEKYVQYRLREVEAYRQLTKDVGAARDAGEKFIEDYVRSTAVLLDEPEKLMALGTAAIKAGSQDPLVRTYFAKVKFRIDEDAAAADQVWNETAEQLVAAGFPRTVHVYAKNFLCDTVNPRDFVVLRQRWRKTAVAIARWLQQESAHPEFRSSVCKRLLNIWNGATFEDQTSILAAVLQTDDIDPYFTHLLAGRYDKARAWQFRGTGWDSTITPDRRVNVAKYLNSAADHFEFAWKLHPELPYAASDMISVEMTGYHQGETCYFWFLEAIKAQFDYYDAYTSFLNSQLTRWGGSKAIMLSLANQCVQTRRFDTFVPYFAIEVLESLVKWEDVALENNRNVSQLLRSLMAARDEFQAANPEAVLSEKGGTYGTRLLLALETCTLWKLAARQARLTGNDMHWTTLRAKGRPARYLTSQLLVAQGDLRGRFLKFDDQLRQPWNSDCGLDVVEALANESRRLKELSTADDAVWGRYFDQVDTIVDELRTFSRGEWTELNIGKDLTGWEPYCDRWYVLEDSTLELSGRWGVAPQVCIRPLANFYPPLEIMGELELAEPEPYPVRAGIGWSREGMSGTEDWLANQPLFGLNANRRTDHASKVPVRHDAAWVWDKGATVHGVHPVAGTGFHRLRLKLWEHYAEFFVDDNVWITLSMPDGLQADGWLCFGANAPERHYGARPNGGSMRWRNLRVRRIDVESPPALSEPLDAREEYWEQRAARDPDDVAALSGLCQVRFEQGRANDVLAMVERILTKTPTINDIRRWKGLVLSDLLHDYAAAIEEFDQVLKDPRDDFEVLARYTEIRAAAPDEALRDSKRAKSMGEFCVKETQAKNPRSLAALAAAYAELGDFEKAIQFQNDAMVGASDSQQEEWKLRLDTYTSGKPLRLPSK